MSSDLRSLVEPYEQSVAATSMFQLISAMYWSLQLSGDPTFAVG